MGLMNHGLWGHHHASKMPHSDERRRYEAMLSWEASDSCAVLNNIIASFVTLSRNR